MAVKNDNSGKGYKYDIASKISYLIGVHKEHILDNTEFVNIYNDMDLDKPSRVIRNLCIVRTCLLRFSGKIQTKMKVEYCSFLSMNEYVNKEAVDQLYKDGVDFYKGSNKTLDQHIIEINRIISDKINNCKHWFPMWLDWSYVRDLFIMPNGFTPEGVNESKQLFFKQKLRFPYQMYLNWIPNSEYYGNILHNDSLIVPIMYNTHNKEFDDWNRVQDVCENTKNGIYSFIEDSDSVVIAVDCENSDPYKMCAALKNLDSKYTSKISKIILIDDVNSATGWGILQDYTAIPVEYKLIERIKKFKSLVDVALSTVICKEFYANGVSSFIVFSSDSDYWGLTSNMPDVKFMFMIERESTANEYKEALHSAGIAYCYLDDFYTGNSDEIKFTAISKELNRLISSVSVNINDLFNEAIRSSRATLTDAERNHFLKNYIKKLYLGVDSDGVLSIKIKTK